MKSPVYLISCCGDKGERQAARTLYRSQWYIAARTWVESRAPWAWFIMSAKHGLLDPSAVIAPYDLQLHELAHTDRQLWAANLVDELHQAAGGTDGLQDRQVVILAGVVYRKDVIELLWRKGAAVQVPLYGLGIGEQLYWLKTANELAASHGR